MKPFKTFISFTSSAVLGLGFVTFGWAEMAHAESHSNMAEHGVMHVTKSPTCGCCGAWITLARDEGYDIEVTNMDDVTSLKMEVGVPGTMWSCHTALIDGYTIEGHIPFEALAKLLEERPDVRGIAVPGMPFGSPGMGDDPTARYDVFAFGGSVGEGEIFYRVGL